MNQTLIRVLQRTPGFRSAAMRVHPLWFFRLTWWSVLVSSCFWPGTIRRSRYFCDVLRENFANKDLRARSRRYLFHVCLYKDFAIAWSNWHHRYEDWITIEGEAHLQTALQLGTGVFLISPHNYGFSKLVAPVLALRGYKIYRGGNGGRRGLSKRSRWGKEYRMSWNYLNYKGDYWQRAQMLKAMQTALRANSVVHVSVRSYQQGDEDTAIEFFGRKYFLDPIWFRVFQLCQAPVLPCFAVGNDNAPINIVIHPPLRLGKTTVKEFAGIQSNYMTKYPEYGRMWKNVHLGRARW
jgi:lipid A biosynthesis acyltransferase